MRRATQLASIPAVTPGLYYYFPEVGTTGMSTEFHIFDLYWFSLDNPETSKEADSMGPTAEQKMASKGSD